LMKRDERLKAFARQRKDEIVVAVYTAAQEITHISPNDLNYTFVVAMGQGSSHALGLALGRPDRRVILFDGDGSLLMISAAWSRSRIKRRRTWFIACARTAATKPTAPCRSHARGKYVLPSWPRPRGTVGR